MFRWQFAALFFGTGAVCSADARAGNADTPPVAAPAARSASTPSHVVAAPSVAPSTDVTNAHHAVLQVKGTWSGWLPGLGAAADLRMHRGLHLGGEASWFSTQLGFYQLMAARISYRIEVAPFVVVPIVGVGHLEPTWESDEAGTVADHSPWSPVGGIQLGVESGWFLFGLEGQITTVGIDRRDVYGGQLRHVRESPVTLGVVFGAKL